MSGTMSFFTSDFYNTGAYLITWFLSLQKLFQNQLWIWWCIWILCWSCDVALCGVSTELKMTSVFVWNMLACFHVHFHAYEKQPYMYICWLAYMHVCLCACMFMWMHAHVDA
jgi:hypothetical protein